MAALLGSRNLARCVPVFRVEPQRAVGKRARIIVAQLALETDRSGRSPIICHVPQRYREAVGLSFSDDLGRLFFLTTSIELHRLGPARVTGQRDRRKRLIGAATCALHGPASEISGVET